MKIRKTKTLLNNIKNYSRNHPLGHKIILHASFCGFAFILFSTAFQLTLEYHREIKAIEHQANFIQNSYSDSLARSLWDIDQAQIELQIKGIKSLPNISSVTLKKTKLAKNTSQKSKPLSKDSLKTHEFPLIHTRNDQPYTLGNLNIEFDLQVIYQRIWNKGFTILLNQTLLVALIILVIMIIFHRKIISHLEFMANYSRSVGDGDLDNTLILNRQKPLYSDELDELAAALNDMRHAIKVDINKREQEKQELRYNRDQLQAIVERRTQSLQRAKETAENANTAKSRFLSTMSHEIRTPINGMLGMIQILQDSPLNKKQTSHINVLYDSTNALLDTFNNVLEYGRISEKGHQVNHSKFSLHLLINNLITLMGPESNRKNIKLTCHYDNDILDYCLAEEVSLRQVILNLLSNAIKFTKNGAVSLHIKKINCDENKQHLRFEIIDTGIGIEAKVQDYIFDRFTQANKSITNKFGGTGLGLSISKEIIEHMNGTIGLISSPNHGSTFWFEVTLKLAKKSTHKAELENLRTLAHPLSILLVEDVVINQQVVLGLLEKEGHHITIIEDGLNALHTAQKIKFDLILMDMNLPSMSGTEISRILRTELEGINKNTQIIALTAATQPESIHEYLEAGITSVIPKPILKKDLFTAIANSNDPINTLSPSKSKIESDLILDKKIIAAHIQALGSEKLSSLMEIFCSVYEELWPNLTQSIDIEDHYDCSQTAHKLAGACDTLGFQHTSRLLRVLEAKADKKSLLNDKTTTQPLKVSAERSFNIARLWNSADDNHYR